MSIEELRISEKIYSATSVEVDFLLPDKAIATIHIFEGSCPDSALATARLMFGDEILWVIQRDSHMTRKVVLTGDGVSTIKIICENACNASYYFNSYCKVSYE